MLCTALGPQIAQRLADPAIIEVMLNPDGRLWIDQLGSGLAATGVPMSLADGKRIIRLPTAMNLPIGEKLVES